MAINYDITDGKLHLNIEINADSINIDLDIAAALGAILASGYGQLLFGAINWAAISTFPWKRDDCPKIAEKYNYSILGDESYQAYCNLMTAVDKVAKYPRAQSAEQQAAGNEVVTSEALLYVNYIFDKVAARLSEFCNSGKAEVRLDEIKDIMDGVGELFQSFENPDPDILARLQADAQNRTNNVPAQAQAAAAPAAPAAAQQNQAATAPAAVGNSNFDNISGIAQPAAPTDVN